MDKNARARATASTQDHLAIKQITDDLVINKNGSVALVLQTSSINFELLADYEQDNKIYAFAGLLNSLNFKIQILIRTKRVDITNYLDYLNIQKERPMTEGLRKQLDIYTLFVKNLIVENDVLDKSFFIVIPYYPGGQLPNVSPLKKKKSKEEQQQIEDMDTSQVIEKAKIFLYPKRDHILKQLGRMGLFGHQLTDKELISEFYTIYNPDEE
ncbi:MAG TPA: hypothetical protein PLS56_00325 [Candidatus Dojkabacteria bacterium]|jgi:hypothetical protein|nr:hypothetical protein [Candidatus Dojkabacteria bacterium]